jgi:hypothetical protein
LSFLRSASIAERSPTAMTTIRIGDQVALGHVERLGRRDRVHLPGVQRVVVETEVVDKDIREVVTALALVSNAPGSELASESLASSAPPRSSVSRRYRPSP